MAVDCCEPFGNLLIAVFLSWGVLYYAIRQNNPRLGFLLSIIIPLAGVFGSWIAAVLVVVLGIVILYRGCIVCQTNKET